MMRAVLVLLLRRCGLRIDRDRPGHQQGGDGTRRERG
jgi:hypothetical protein